MKKIFLVLTLICLLAFSTFGNTNNADIQDSSPTITQDNSIDIAVYSSYEAPASYDTTMLHAVWLHKALDMSDAHTKARYITYIKHKTEVITPHKLSISNVEALKNSNMFASKYSEQYFHNLL